jgi:gephyrin
MQKTSPDPVLRVGILTVSDRSARGERLDAAGPKLAEAVITQGWKIIYRQIRPDDQSSIEEILTAWCDSGEPDAILTTGGTGFT